jgi:hypothetical protein
VNTSTTMKMDIEMDLDKNTDKDTLQILKLEKSILH